MKEALAKISEKLGRNFNPSIRWGDTAQRIFISNTDLEFYVDEGTPTERPDTIYNILVGEQK